MLRVLQHDSTAISQVTPELYIFSDASVYTQVHSIMEHTNLVCEHGLRSKQTTWQAACYVKRTEAEYVKATNLNLVTIK